MEFKIGKNATVKIRKTTQQEKLESAVGLVILGGIIYLLMK